MQIEILFTAETIVGDLPNLPSLEIGAVIEFHGIVREMEGGQALKGLFYEVYESMARTILSRHLEELGEIHGCAAVRLIHRTGWVPVGETSLYLTVMSAHRAEGLRFIAAAIDRLKLDVPIWKCNPPKRVGTN